MKTLGAAERRIKILSTAGLIAGFYSGSSVRKIYSSIVSHYETLLSILEDRETAEEVSRLMGLPVENIKEITDAIIVRLLFNRRNDPFVSLGLRHSVTPQEARRRWKRLIMLYHPDRHQGAEISDDKAKRINEAFNEVSRKTKEGFRVPERKAGVDAEERKTTDDKAEISREFIFQHVRYIPRVILASAVMLAASMLLFFIYRVVSVTR